MKKNFLKSRKQYCEFRQYDSNAGKIEEEIILFKIKKKKYYTEVTTRFPTLSSLQINLDSGITMRRELSNLKYKKKKKKSKMSTLICEHNLLAISPNPYLLSINKKS